MKKIFSAILISGMLFSGTANAEIVTYEGVGQYLMSEFETPDLAKQRAKQRAEKSAQEKAGIFVKSNTKVVNLKLESEEVEVMTAGIMKVHSVNYEQQFDSSGNGIIFTAKVLVDINTDDVDNWLQKSVAEKELLVEQNKSLKNSLAEQEKKLEELKAKLAKLENSKSVLPPSAVMMTQMQLTGEIANADAIFLSNEKLKAGLASHGRGDFQSAINFYSEAIQLNRNNSAAFTWRGNALGTLGNYQGAVMDLSRAVQLDNKNSIAYTGLGIAYYSMSAYAQAINALTSAIQLDDKNGKAYYARSACYKAIGRFSESQLDELAVQRLGYRLQ